MAENVKVDNRCDYEEKKKGLVLKFLIHLITIWVVLKKSFLKLFNYNPKINSFFVDGLSTAANKIKKTATTWRSLEFIYKYDFYKRKGFTGKINDFWMCIENIPAVRNRLKLVQRDVYNFLKEIGKQKKDIKILSIASGSARAVIEVAGQLKKEGFEVEVNLLDLDKTAIQKSKELACENGIESNVNFIVDRASSIDYYLESNSLDLIEMVGFLDYRPKEKALILMGKIRNLLVEDGFFITANVCPNDERLFLKYVINWNMIYRKPKELEDLIIKSNFSEYNLVLEPLKIHAIVSAKK